MIKPRPDNDEATNRRDRKERIRRKDSRRGRMIKRIGRIEDGKGGRRDVSTSDRYIEAYRICSRGPTAEGTGSLVKTKVMRCFVAF